MKRLPAVLILLWSATTHAAACDLRFDDQAAFVADWTVRANSDWAKPDEAGRRLFLAQCRDCLPTLSLSVRVTDLSLGTDTLSRMATAAPMNRILDDLKTRQKLLDAYRQHQAAMFGDWCSRSSFSGRRELGDVTFAVFSSDATEGRCAPRGAFSAVEYLGYKNSCGYRLRFTWLGSYSLQKEPFEKARQLLKQVRVSP